MSPKPIPDFDWGEVDAARLKVDGASLVRPSGAFTAAEYATKYKFSRSGSKDSLIKLVKAGVIEKIEAFPASYYRVVKLPIK